MNKTTLLLAIVVAASIPVSPAQAGDRDHDKLPDRWEKRFRTGVKTSSASRDLDRDGLRNLDELRAGTKPRTRDSDRDRVPDSDEDPDRDRVDNANESREGTHPRRRDSDRDGRGDGREDLDHDGLSNSGEDLTGNDPLDRDSDDDGVRDGAETAGVFLRLQGETFTIRLARGGTFSGRLDGEAAIECVTEDREERGHRRARKSRGRDRARARATIEEEGLEEELGPVEGNEGVEDDPIEPEDDDAIDEEFDDGFDDEFDDGLETETEGGSRGPSGSGRCSAEQIPRGARINDLQVRRGADGAVVSRIRLIL